MTDTEVGSTAGSRRTARTSQASQASQAARTAQTPRAGRTALDTLAEDRGQFTQENKAKWVAGVLRTRIMEGLFQPNDRLPEKEITEALKVSRNTLREAFWLLTDERLLEREHSRGVFVRQPSIQDVADIYRVRRIVECAAVRGIGKGRLDLDALEDAVVEGEDAAANQDWRGLGTANMHFHRGIAALAQSPRIDELMSRILAELRLVFHIMESPRSFHEPYLARNAQILDTIRKREAAKAEHLLGEYLDDAKKQIIIAYGPRAL